MTVGSGTRWQRFTAWAARLDQRAEDGAEPAVPPELLSGLQNDPSSLTTWRALQPDERARLARFVHTPRLARNRKRHANVIVRLCATGADEVRRWMNDNGGLSDTSTMGPPGWTGG